MSRVTLGLHHEQQHQELLLTDIKNLLALNPLRPVYREAPDELPSNAGKSTWLEFPAGIHSAGSDGKGFSFDNETPRHRVFLERFALAARPVSNGEYLEFMEAGGYRDAALWLSDGWRKLNEAGWQAPQYWEQIEGQWWHMTLSGLRRVDRHAPVCHVSYFEADAFARWAGKRLPTEFEWETSLPPHYRSRGICSRKAGCIPARHLIPPTSSSATSGNGPAALTRPILATSLWPVRWGIQRQVHGQPMVLRGGSCVTPRLHIRATYRNFFYPADRWQFMRACGSQHPRS